MSPLPPSVQPAAALPDQVRVISSLAELEASLHSEPLSEWPALMDRDPTSTVFQSPDWALPWYRTYVDFDPLILVVVREGHLVGIVPLARERATGRITFAGDAMADYRDIVALPEHRGSVVAEFLKYYRAGGFPNPLMVGPTLLESATPALLEEGARAAGVHTVTRWNNGWRWWPGEQAEDPLKKKSIRYPINYFRRGGVLRAARLETPEEWVRFKEEFYRQHSLRQIFGGRVVTLDDPRKREFFDELVASPCGHVTALYWNETLIAGHIGSVFKNVLYWGAPAFDVRQRHYSPNLVLLAMTIANRDLWGFPVGMDLTMGKGEVKERFSNSRVQLAQVELFASSRQYFFRKARTAATTAVRAAAERIGGDGSWEKQIKPAVEDFAEKLRHALEAGPAQCLRKWLSQVAHLIGERSRGIVFIARPEDVRNVRPGLKADERITCHDNDIYTFLNRSRWDDGPSREIGNMVRQYADLLRAGRTVHTIQVNDRLAGWGCSYCPTEPASLTETGGAPLEFQPNSVSLYGFYTVPEFRGRKLYQSLLSHILAKRFAEGAALAYISVEASNLPSRKAIERVGFKALTVNEWTRFLKWSQLRSRPA